AAGRCARQDAHLQRQRARDHESLDGARSRARQPHRAAVARRQGGRARPPGRRADPDPRPDVRRAEALRYGNADMKKTANLISLGLCLLLLDVAAASAADIKLMTTGAFRPVAQDVI